VTFWQKTIGAKAARKILMKLTTGDIKTMLEAQENLTVNYY